MKYKQFLLSIALLTFAISFMIYPTKATAITAPSIPASISGYTLLPPLCFVNEMYETEDESADITPEEIITNENVVVKVRFKIFDVIKNFFDRFF